MSSGAGFPINDLLRRKLQTSLVVVTLTLSVASTLFLLLFSSRVGVGLIVSSGTFTVGLTSVFDQFILFIGILVFLVGAVLTSFIVMLMTAQRIRDFGLLKAAGCPNSLVGGYFMTELLTVTALSCVLGIAGGFIADFVAANVVFGAYSLRAWWFAPVVFAVFFCLALFFGLQPILKATRMTAIEALSPVNYYGLVIIGKHKTLSHSALAWRVASRSMVRRISPVARIVILLSIVFVLLTISVAGGIIAKDTTTGWIQKTSGAGTIAVAYSNMGSQYELLLSKFTGAQQKGYFNYSDSELGVPSEVNERLKSISHVASVDSRLVLYMDVKEVSNYTAINGVKTIIGGEREGTSLIIGVDSKVLAADFSSKGRSLSQEDPLEAVIGDSISQTMYIRSVSSGIQISDPLLQSIKAANTTFQIVGVCIDPINNGYVTYVPAETLMNATGITSPNLLLLTLNGSADRATVVAEIRDVVKSVDSSLEVLDLEPTLHANEAFLGAAWQTIMLIPLFSLASAAVCLVSYMMLVVDEQRQEFTVLRAVGARPKLIISLSAFESAIVLLSSFGIGISFGVIVTLMILMANPLVTAATIAMISLWLIATLVGMFILSLYPAVRLSKIGILQIGS
jgi:ABC-type antimicrobial peptide transport system permease subunit